MPRRRPWLCKDLVDRRALSRLRNEEERGKRVEGARYEWEEVVGRMVLCGAVWYGMVFIVVCARERRDGRRSGRSWQADGSRGQDGGAGWHLLWTVDGLIDCELSLRESVRVMDGRGRYSSSGIDSTNTIAVVVVVQGLSWHWTSWSLQTSRRSQVEVEGSWNLGSIFGQSSNRTKADFSSRQPYWEKSRIKREVVGW